MSTPLLFFDVCLTEDFALSLVPFDLNVIVCMFVFVSFFNECNFSDEPESEILTFLTVHHSHIVILCSGYVGRAHGGSQ